MKEHAQEYIKTRNFNSHDNAHYDLIIGTFMTKIISNHIIMIIKTFVTMQICILLIVSPRAEATIRYRRLQMVVIFVCALHNYHENYRHN